MQIQGYSNASLTCIEWHKAVISQLYFQKHEQCGDIHSQQEVVVVLKELLDSLEGGEALQGDHNRPVDWVITNQVKYKNKCWVLHLGQDNPGYTYRLGGLEAEDQLCRKGSG